MEDGHALNRGVTLPDDAKEMVHQNVSEQDVQQFRNRVQDFYNSYNATHNAKQSHGDDTPVEIANPTMPSQQDQQRVLAEIMRSLASWDQSRPNADTPMPVVTQKPGNRMDKQEDTRTRSVQSPSAQQSGLAMEMEKFLTAVKKEQKSADDHRFMQNMVGLLHGLSKKAKNITGTDQEQITTLVGRLGKQYGWNKDDQNKVIAESMRQGHVSPANTMVYPDAVTSSVTSLSSLSNDTTSHTRSTPEKAPVMRVQRAKVQDGPVQAGHTGKVSPVAYDSRSLYNKMIDQGESEQHAQKVVETAQLIRHYMLMEKHAQEALETDQLKRQSSPKTDAPMPVVTQKPNTLIDKKGHTQSTPEMMSVQRQKVQGGPVQACYTAKASGRWTLDVNGHVTHGTRDQRPVLPLKYRGVEWKTLHDFLESQHTDPYIKAALEIHKQKMRTAKTKPSLDKVVSKSWLISPEFSNGRVIHGTRDVLDPELIHRFDIMFGSLFGNPFGKL